MNIKKVLGTFSAAALIFAGGVYVPDTELNAYAAADVSVMEPTDSTYDLIKELEGFSSECRWDNTQWTIGYGTKCPFDHPTNGSYQLQKGGHTVTEEEAREICHDLMQYFVGMVRSNCAGLSMEQNQFDALISAAYNHGNVNACPLKYYLQGTLSKEEAYSQYLEWYILPGSMYETGLRNRRKREADLFFGGEVKTECSCTEDYAGTYTTSGVTTYLNIRSESAHSLSGAIVGKIEPGAVFTVTKANGTIAHVQYNGTSGIVSMEYIKRNEPLMLAPVVSAGQGSGSDVNGDSIVDGRDASAVLTDYARISAGYSSAFSGSQRIAADANNDSVIDGRDASVILTYYTAMSVNNY